ncbi:unnamed protein product [Amoebophrya sp. A25]|nr:unnamed protein product [Amoebophrya sp. A25]|eukprot:GSA25T00021607001.1
MMNMQGIFRSRCYRMLQIPDVVLACNLLRCNELSTLQLQVTNAFQYSVWKTWSKPVEKRDWRAMAAISAAVPLSLVFPMAIVFVYVGKVSWPESKMWEDGSWIPNIGWAIFLWVLRYLGFILLGWGILRVTGLGKRISKKWAELIRETRGEQPGEDQYVADQEGEKEQGRGDLQHQQGRQEVEEQIIANDRSDEENGPTKLRNIVEDSHSAIHPALVLA